jgi:hypothetical protein
MVVGCSHGGEVKVIREKCAKGEIQVTDTVTIIENGCMDKIWGYIERLEVTVGNSP